MNILHLCNADIKGGAARACTRISDAVALQGINSKIFVQRKFGNDMEITSADNGFYNKFRTNSRISLDMLVRLLFSNTARGRFSFHFVGLNPLDITEIKNADIIHLHWINEGFLSLKGINALLQNGKRIVWTMHDSWTFTGGCHIPFECRNFETQCRQCPQLKFPGKRDFSSYNQKDKSKILNNKNIVFAAPSRWLQNMALNSFILKNRRVVVIPNPIDHNVFRPVDKTIIRKKYHLPQDRKIILFSAATTDKNKGFNILLKALSLLKANTPSFTLLLLGKADLPQPDLNRLNVINMGYFSDEKQISEIYSASDVSVVPSLQENLSNSIMESLSCGTPVIAFNIGGNSDMIDHLNNGYLADPLSAEDFSNGILWCLEDPARYLALSAAAREKVLNNFTPEMIGAKYRSLYIDILSI